MNFKNGELEIITMALFGKKYFGIDIYDNSIKVMELSGASKNASVKSYGSLDLQPKVIENGQVLNKEQLAGSIKQAMARAVPKGISTTDCIFSLPESKLILTHVQISKKTDKTNFNQEVQKKVLESIPFDPKEIYSDHKIVLDYEDYSEVLFAAVQRNILDDFIEVFKLAELNLQIVDFESDCMARALISTCNMNDAYAIIDIGGRTTIFSIYDYCGIRFSNNISIAGNTFSNAIAEKWDLSFQNSEEFKKVYGLDPVAEEGKVMLVLQKPIQELLAAVRKDINYYQDKTGRKISKIILCGGSALMPKLPEYFTKNLNIPSEIGNPLIKVKDGINITNKIFYTTVIGLALRGLENKPKEAGIDLLKNINIKTK